MYVFLCFKKKAQVFTKGLFHVFAITDIQFILVQTKKDKIRFCLCQHRQGIYCLSG